MKDCYADGGEVKPDSGIIDKIREFMMSHGGLAGADNREFDTAYNVDTSSQPARNYAEGGEIPDFGMPPIGPSSFDVGNMSTTYRTNGAIPAPLPSGMPTALPNMPPAMAPAPPPGHMGPSAPMAASPAPVAGAPVPGIGMADILKDAQGLGKSAYGNYTPENRAEMLAYLAQKQNGMPYAIGNSLASVGDAIARGYGHSQSNFLNDSLGREDANRKEAMDSFDTGSKMHSDEMKTGLGLMGEMPSSAPSRMAQQAYSPVLRKMGYTPQQIALMPESKISTVADLGVKYADVQTQKDLKQATLVLQDMQARASIANQQSQRREEAAKTIAGQSPMHRAMSGIFGQNPGDKALENELGVGESTGTQSGWKYVGKVGK